MKKQSKFIFSGVLFLLLVEFMYTFQINKNFIGFLMTPIIQIPFLLVSFHIGNFLDKKLPSKIAQPIIYFITGMIGLIFIEWMYAGLTPGSGAWQLLMFTFWGGAVVFARINIDDNKNTNRVKKSILRFFTSYAIIGILLGFLVPVPNFIYLISLIGYGFMNVFYFWYFTIKYKENSNN